MEVGLIPVLGPQDMAQLFLSHCPTVLCARSCLPAYDFQFAPILLATASGHMMCVSSFVLGQADLSYSHTSFQFAADRYEKQACKPRSHDSLKLRPSDGSKV